MIINLPYGHTSISCQLPKAHIIEPHMDGPIGQGDGRKIVSEAMKHPINSQSLCELAVGKKTATIIISDHTRPVPSRDIIPLMLEELRQGNPEIKITLLVATGCHRGTTHQELIDKLGENIVRSERIVIHDAFDEESNVFIGTLPSEAPLVIDKCVVETELLVAEGFIEPHFFAGFSGGRKSVLPGVCDRITVLRNHCGKFIDSPYARTGILENNPIHEDMEAASELAKLKYIVNVIIDEEKKTVAAFAGEPHAAHTAGVRFLRKYCEVNAAPGDIVITTNGGAPLDQNLYQCVKSLTAAEASAKPGAVLILCAELEDGIGGEGFYRAFRDCKNFGEMYQKYTETVPEETETDQWQSQILCRIRMKHRVIVVSRQEMERKICEMNLEFAPDLETALFMAGDGDITVIPNGVSVIIKE